jgi:hypothetical protein
MASSFSRAGASRSLRAAAAAAAVAATLAACGSSVSSGQPAGQATGGATHAATVASAPAVAASAPASTAAAAANRTADPVAAGVLDRLNGLASYQFKFTLKGGSYASSVGPAGVAGTVINGPSFAVQFTYADIEIIEIQGNNWTRNGSSWDPSLYPNSPTTYDSYGPAILLSHYFPASIAAYYTAAGDDTVNSVAVTRYTALPTILNSMAGYWGVKPGATLGGDIWIAKSGGYPVRWKVTGTGTDDFEFLVDITNANDPANTVVVPAS